MMPDSQKWRESWAHILFPQNWFTSWSFILSGPHTQVVIGIPTLLRHDHGGAALAVAHVDALGVRHQKEVPHGALTPIVESKVEEQHALVVLADRTAHKGKE